VPAVVLALSVTTGCGGQSQKTGSHPAPTSRSTSQAGTPQSANGSANPRPAVLHVIARRRLPAPVQLPALARLADGTVLAIGGLDSVDQSVDSIVRLAPGLPRSVGTLPAAAHDVGVAGLGDRAYAFGGGSAAGPLTDIRAIGSSGAVHTAGRLTTAMSDTSAATLGNTVYVVGGYTTTTPLRSVLAFRPGAPLTDVATLPHPLRYAAVAAVGGRLLIAGGTDGVRGRREILSVDPATHRVSLIARLPRPLSHAGGAAIGGLFYVLGGRGDALTSQQATIWVVDPVGRSVRRAGRLPIALSDVGVVAAGDRIMVAGGRDAGGTVHDELWTLGTR
jgi:hypothetical protein